MKQSNASRRERPLAPDLQTYRPTLTMVMSIVHRATGAALYVGFIAMAGWLLALASGPVRAESGGGSIELMNLSQGVRAETGGGGITAQFVASRGGFSNSVLDTPAGDITVYLAPSLPVTVHAAVDMGDGHKIQSDFTDIKVVSEGGEYGPKRITAEGSLNGGGPVLKVHTTSGDIRLLRSK